MDDAPTFWQAARAAWRHPRALARLLHAEVTHLAWRTGLRGYCWPCDRLRWVWTHRQCQARQHEAATEWLAANPWILDAAKQALRDRRQP